MSPYGEIDPTNRPGCGKHRFTSRREAKEYAARIRKGKAGGKHQRPYRCTDERCVEAGYWHLTSMPASHTTYYKDQDTKQQNRRRNERRFVWPFFR